jgi:sulfopyruvate decarboxylase alpha subunit
MLADQVIASGVDVLAYVPDNRLRGIVAALEGRLPIRVLTREDECIAFACGHRAAGGRPLVMMQSSGVGNCLNPIGSLVVPFALSFPIVVTMRGALGEENPSQVPLGRAVPALLEAFGTQCFSVRFAHELTSVASRVFTLGFESGIPAALLLETTLADGR